MWDWVGASQSVCSRLCIMLRGWFPSWPLQREENPLSLCQRDLCPHQGDLLLHPLKTLSAGSWWVTLREILGHLIGVLLLWPQALNHWYTSDCICFAAQWKLSLQDAGGRARV